MPQFDDPDFQRLAASLGDVTPTSSRSFDLVFDDNLCVTVSVHLKRPDVCVDVWCHDVSAYVGAPRRALVDTLLLLNRSAQAGQPFRVGWTAAISSSCTLARLWTASRAVRSAPG